jgi:predicted trehalose synthase
MNTSFHMTRIDRAYASLALTRNDTTLHGERAPSMRVQIGSQRLEIGMASSETLEAAMQQLRRRMTITLSETRAICDAWNAATAEHEQVRSF